MTKRSKPPAVCRLNRKYAPTGSNSFFGTQGIAELIASSGITSNSVPDFSAAWIRNSIGNQITGKYLAEEGLIRFSTKIIDTGVQNDSSDDTEVDSLQIICIGREYPLDSTKTGPNGGSQGEPNRLNGSAGQGIQVVRLKKIEKIERRIEN